MNISKLNKTLIFVVPLIIVMLVYLSYDRLRNANIIRQVHKDEFDNFDIQAHKNFVAGGNYQVEQADAGTDHVPTKTSEFVAYCDESIEECMQY